MADQFTIISNMQTLLNDLHRVAAMTLKMRREMLKAAKDSQMTDAALAKLDRQAKKVTAGIVGIIAGTAKARNGLLGLRNAANELTLTWKTMSRLVASSLIARSITVFMTKLRDGLKEAKDYIKEISAVQTLDKRVLPFEQWASGLRELSDAWGVDLIDQTRAAYQALSNQVVDGAEAFEFMAAANKLALTALTSTENSVKILSSAINAFDLDVSQADEIAAKLFKTVELGRNKIEDIADSYGRVAKPASQLNIRMEELNAALATLTRQGVKPQEAMTQLNGIFIKLLKPTTQMKKLIREMGYDSAESAIDVLSFGGFLEKLNDITRGSSTEIAKYINRQRGLRGILSLVGKGLNTYNDSLGLINTSYDTFGDKTNIVLNTSAKRFDIAMQQISNSFTVDFGVNVINTLDSVTGGFEALSATVKFLARNFEFFMVPAIALVTSALIKMTIAASIAIATNPWLGVPVLIGLVVAGIIAATNAYQSQIDTMKELDAANAEHYAKQQRLAEMSAKDIEVGLDNMVRATTEALSVMDKAYFENTENILRNYEVISKEVTDILNDSSKILKDRLSEIDSEIKSIQGSLEKLPEISKDVNAAFDEAIFGIQQKGRSPAEQIKGITDEISRLRKVQKDNAARGDTKAIAETTKEIIDLLQEQRKLYDEISSGNEKARNNEEKLGKKLNEENQKYLQRRLDAEDKLARARKGGDPMTIRNAQRDLNELVRKHSDKVSEIKETLAGTVTIDIEQRDIVKELNQERENTNKLLKQAGEIQERNLKKQLEARKLAALELAQFEENVRQFSITRTGIEKLRDIEDPDELKSQVTGKLGVIGKSIAALQSQELTADSVRQIQLLLDAQESILAIQQEQEKYIARRSQKKIIEDEIKAAKELVNQLKKAADNITELRSKLDADLTKSFEALTELLPTTKTTRGGKLIQTLQSSGGLFGTGGIRELATERQRDVAGGAASEVFRILQAIKDSGGVVTPAYARALETNLETLQSVFKEIQSSADPESAAILKKEVASVDSLYKLIKQETEFGTIDQMTTDHGKYAGALKIAKDGVNELQEAMGIANKEFPTATKGFTNVKTALDGLSERLNRATVALQALQKQAAASAGVAAAAAAVSPNRTPAYVPPVTQGPSPQQFGGYIHGRDTIPALLQDGEFVMNREAAAKFRTQLVAMNSGMGLYGGGETNNFGDFNISVNSSGNESIDAVKIGRAIKREIRRGRLSFK